MSHISLFANLFNKSFVSNVAANDGRVNRLGTCRLNVGSETQTRDPTVEPAVSEV